MIQTTSDNISLDFSKMFLDDPIMVALWDGTMNWGDIPGILDNTTTILDSTTANTDAPSNQNLSNQNLLEHTHNQPLIVPPYTPGIKTIITRNLPRDISIDKLRAVFEKYGPIRDIYIPKNMDKSSPYFGTIKGFALIKFLKHTDSAHAYQSEYGRLTIGRNNITVEFAKEDR